MLAADSRVTLLTTQAPMPGQPGPMLVPATFDNARKLLRIASQPYIGVVTYGTGAFGTLEPRTAHSFLPDFETVLEGEPRLSVGEFAERLSTFFAEKWNALMPANHHGPDLVFLVAGFDENAAYGRVFEIAIPSSPQPREPSPGGFGLVWGGQREIVDRILQGFDERAIATLQSQLTVTDPAGLRDQLKKALGLPIPYNFLPLQDCVDLATLLVRATAQLQSWVVGPRGVGGPVDVATITRTEGFVEIQMKKIQGEHL